MGFLCYSSFKVQQNKDTEKNKQLDKRALIGIAFELGFIIALPVVVFGLFGKWLDERFGTEPILVLVGIFTAMVSTTIWIHRKFKKYF